MAEQENGLSAHLRQGSGGSRRPALEFLGPQWVTQGPAPLLVLPSSRLAVTSEEQSHLEPETVISPSSPGASGPLPWPTSQGKLGELGVLAGAFL